MPSTGLEPAILWLQVTRLNQFGHEDFPKDTKNCDTCIFVTDLVLKLFIYIFFYFVILSFYLSLSLSLYLYIYIYTLS